MNFYKFSQIEFNLIGLTLNFDWKYLKINQERVKISTKFLKAFHSSEKSETLPEGGPRCWEDPQAIADFFHWLAWEIKRIYCKISQFLFEFHETLKLSPQKLRTRGRRPLAALATLGRVSWGAKTLGDWSRGFSGPGVCYLLLV